MEILLLIWFLQAGLVAYIASKAGRSGCLWFIIGTVIPLVGLLIVACFKPDKKD
jgi:hypothetical protein